MHCGINNLMVINTEHVTTDSLEMKKHLLLPLVRESGPDDLPGVLDDHLPSIDVPLASGSSPSGYPPVNADGLLGGVLQVPKAHGHGQVEAGQAP
ncbi:unnamed protein product [Ixodes persulcatus]